MKWPTIILVALSTLVTACSQSNPPPPVVAGWQVGYSEGTTLSYPTSSLWSFTFPQYPGHVNMVTKTVAGLKGSQITAVFQETESNPQWFWAFDAGNTCNPGSLPQIHLYFQRVGDDFSGVGDKQYYRWWSRGFNIEAGTIDVSFTFDPSLWISVYGLQNPTMFAAALANASSVGMVFGGGCFAGHGVALKGGNAAMTLRSFVVQ